ncbi:hypothetical protein JCM10450v2_001703 [Rhodotorula kratochvilovae]
MASSAPGTSQTLVSPAAHLHLAPSYAAPPPSSPSTTSRAVGSTSKPIPGASQPSLRPFAPDELKKVVLEYLCSRCYVDSARAFAHELASAGTGPSGDDEADIPASVAARPEPAGASARSEAMEGVETTPEPVLTSAGEAGGGNDAPPVSNGKSVAFLDGEGDEEEDDVVLEGSLLAKEDLRDARLRRDIRDSILGGRISHAVDLLNEHYPSVLASSPPSSSSAGLSSPSKLAPSHHLSPKHSRCTPQSFFVPPSPTTSSSTTLSSKPLIGARFGPHAQSLSPAILSLNLQTQVFVELMRSAYATSAHSTPSTPTPSLNGGGTNGGGGGSSDADMSASTSSLGTFSILNVAIAQAQALAEKVSLLPPGRDREGWEKERVDVSALLAYKNVESCEVRGYFEEGRKEALAEMVNAAILQSTRRTPLPLLELAARQATAFWATLREMNVPFPPAPAGRPAAADNGGKGKPARTYPAFDLHAFLHERDPSTTPADGDTEMA